MAKADLGVKNAKAVDMTHRKLKMRVNNRYFFIFTSLLKINEKGGLEIPLCQIISLGSIYVKHFLIILESRYIAYEGKRSGASYFSLISLLCTSTSSKKPSR